MIDAGPIRQYAFVTRDIQASMAYYTDHLGVGPWFFAQAAPIVESYYRGAPCPLRIAAAIAVCGDVQIELVQTLCDTPSMYLDWTARPFARELQQHVAFWPHDYDASLAAALRKGYRAEQGGATGYGRFVYLLHPDNPDLAVELSEVTPLRAAFYDGMAAAAKGWDGKDPIRPFSAATSG